MVVLVVVTIDVLNAEEVALESTIFAALKTVGRGSPYPTKPEGEPVGADTLTTGNWSPFAEASARAWLKSSSALSGTVDRNPILGGSVEG